MPANPAGSDSSDEREALIRIVRDAEHHERFSEHLTDRILAAGFTRAHHHGERVAHERQQHAEASEGHAAAYHSIATALGCHVHDDLAAKAAALRERIAAESATSAPPMVGRPSFEAMHTPMGPAGGGSWEDAHRAPAPELGYALTCAEKERDAALRDLVATRHDLCDQRDKAEIERNAAIARAEAAEAKLAKHAADQCLPRACVEDMLSAKMPCGHPDGVGIGYSPDGAGRVIRCRWCDDKRAAESRAAALASALSKVAKLAPDSRRIDIAEGIANAALEADRAALAGNGTGEG